MALATVCWLGGQASGSGLEVYRERAVFVAREGVDERRQDGGPAIPQAAELPGALVASKVPAAPPASARRASVMTVLTPLSSSSQATAPSAPTTKRPSSTSGSRAGHVPEANQRVGTIRQYIDYHPATVVVTSSRLEATGDSPQGGRPRGAVDEAERVAPVESWPHGERFATASSSETAFDDSQGGGGLQFASRRPQTGESGLGVVEGLPLPNRASPRVPPTATITDPLQIAGRPRALREIQAQIQPPTGLLPPQAQEVIGLRSWTVDAQELAMSRSDVETVITWEAPASCHRGLLFEEPNLERHGYSIGLFQPALSAAHFFGRVPVLPYLAVSERANRVQYTLGRHRPGSAAPMVWNIPRPTPLGGVLEASAIVGVLYAFP